jgi:hypothetical protein
MEIISLTDVLAIVCGAVMLISTIFIWENRK